MALVPIFSDTLQQFPRSEIPNPAGPECKAAVNDDVVEGIDSGGQLLAGDYGQRLCA